MSETIVLANRLREVLLNGHWIANTNYKDQLLGLSREQAVQKIGTLNTIAALTFHINYYLAGLLNAFHTGKLQISDQYSFDVPPFQSEKDWKKMVDDFLVNAEDFANYVEQMSNTKLDEPFIDEKYGNYLRNIEGVIEHCYYHLGQIVLIKKLITARA